jgi:arylsulfatase A-like enzyme
MDLGDENHKTRKHLAQTICLIYYYSVLELRMEARGMRENAQRSTRNVQRSSCGSLSMLAALALLPLALCAADRPNVVIVLIDDMGYGDIGPFGATKQKTPNLDRMATEGMKLTSFYAAPVCSVSRAQLMTGCYGARVSVPGVFFPGQSVGLHPAEFTIAERLKALGYATQCVGKWHLGDQPEFLPTRQGFDHYFGIPYSNDMQKKALATGEQTVPLLRDEAVAELLTDEQQTCLVERYTKEAVGFIRANKDRPFFLYFPHSAVHTPIHPGKAFEGKSANGRFGDWVEEVDWSVGRVLETLRELKLDRNTLVVFTSDNGPWLIRGADGGSAGPLRGGKGSTWEGGVREPTLAWWPGKVPAGSVCDAVAGTIDLLPTCVALAGGQVPAEPVIDGRDISALLLGQSKQSAREAHYYFASYNLQAVRQGPWKLAVAPQNEAKGRDLPDDVKASAVRLYNLDEDIGERSNVADKHPDVVAKLQGLIAAMDAEIGGKEPKARRPAGEVEEAKTVYPMAGYVPKDQAGKGGAAKPLGQLKPGDALGAADAPRVERRPFALACEVETAQQDAVIVAHGGSTVGYALYLKGGLLAFSVRTGPDATAEIVASAPASGRARVTATLGVGGKMTLEVNGGVAASGRAAGLLPRQPAEGFCVGHDAQVPAAAYGPIQPFKGAIENLKVSEP